MRSIFLVLSACGAVSHASECQAADEASLLQGRSLVRLTSKKTTDAKALLKSVRHVADSLTEGSDTTISGDEVQDALTAASEALAELSPAIRRQVEMAQQQMNHATAAVQACHAASGATMRARLEEQVDQKSLVVESCKVELQAALEAEEEACTRAEDCLCDEARAHHTDQAAICASRTETYKTAFCEHHAMCKEFHSCHANEMEVYNSLKADVEAEMALVEQEYITTEQAACLTNLVRQAMTPPMTPISHAALIACGQVDVSGLAISMPELPAQPAACPHAPCCEEEQ